MTNPATHDEILAEAKKYSKIAHWRGRGSLYAAAVCRGIVQECTAHMPKKTKDITNDEIVTNAKRYNFRMEWKCANRAYYDLARLRGIMGQCTEHMGKATCPRHSHQVYVYEFADKSAYVGLTWKPHSRHKSHLKGGPVAQKLRLCSVYEIRVLAEFLQPEEATELETATVARYAANGWTILNTAPCGALGAIHGLPSKWTTEKVLKIASNCTSYTEFYTRHKGAYKWLSYKGHGVLHPFIKFCVEKYSWRPPKSGPMSAAYSGTMLDCIDKLAEKNIKTVADWRLTLPQVYLRAKKQAWRNKISSHLHLKKW